MSATRERDLTPDVRKQITDAAARMYRAGVWGTPTLHRPIGLDLYAQETWRQEDTDEWSLGYCDHRDRPALVYLIEALRQMNGCNRDSAITCINLALNHLESA